jgi:hypothetical protein
MAVIINNHDEEVGYEVEGTPFSGTLDPDYIISFSLSGEGEGPWTVKFNDNFSLTVNLTDADDGAMIYTNSTVAATKHLPAV